MTTDSVRPKRAPLRRSAVPKMDSVRASTEAATTSTPALFAVSRRNSQRPHRTEPHPFDHVFSGLFAPVDAEPGGEVPTFQTVSGLSPRPLGSARATVGLDGASASAEPGATESVSIPSSRLNLSPRTTGLPGRAAGPAESAALPSLTKAGTTPPSATNNRGVNEAAEVLPKALRRLDSVEDGDVVN